MRLGVSIAVRIVVRIAARKIEDIRGSLYLQ